MHNLSVNHIAHKPRLQVPSALRVPAAGYLERFGGGGLAA